MREKHSLAQKNSAVSRDCAEPHENPNLTHVIETRAPGSCSNYVEEKGRLQWLIQPVGAKKTVRSGPFDELTHRHRYDYLSQETMSKQVTSARGEANIAVQIDDNEWQTARGDGA